MTAPLATRSSASRSGRPARPFGYEEIVFRTKGIPPVAPGMTQFEKIAEGKRLVHESALRHSLRVYQGHPALKEIDGLENAIRNGDDG